MKIKETILLSVLNVALPSVDVYSDLGLIMKFYVGSRRNPWCDKEEEAGNIEWRDVLSCYYDNSVPTSNVSYTPHYTWGSLMLVPFLLNYLFCWYIWATTDKRKSVSWVAALLSFYPQYVALKIIFLIWSNPKKGLQKKRYLERDIIQFETCCEAVPSTLVMTYLLMRASGGGLKGREFIFDWHNLSSADSVLFFVAFSTSIITSSLGLAKNLKVGPCRILPEMKKCLGGLLSPRFLLIFFVCGFTFIGKGVALASSVSRKCPGDLLPGAIIAISTLALLRAGTRGS